MSGRLRLVCQASFAWYVRPASPGQFWLGNLDRVVRDLSEKARVIL